MGTDTENKDIVENTPNIGSSKGDTSNKRTRSPVSTIQTANTKPNTNANTNANNDVGTKVINIEDRYNSPTKKIKIKKYYDNLLVNDMLQEEPEEESELERNEIQNIVKKFPEIIKHNYTLIENIGEGTFSKVYKAIHLKQNERQKMLFPNTNNIVAVKFINVTSSANRILNELNIVNLVSDHPNIAPLYDVLRYEDQIAMVIPYYHNDEFRDYYKYLPIQGIKNYTSQLLKALEFIHTKGIIHRDIKPNNFLYDVGKGKGILVDFGLAEREQETSSSSSSKNKTQICPCKSNDKSSTLSNSLNEKLYLELTKCIPHNETRRSLRVSRAGTRGFRAPEVLLNCSSQTCKIDIWSVGVMLLCFITRRFPIFQSHDDVESLLELTLIFGVDTLRKACKLHGLGLKMNSDKYLNMKTKGYEPMYLRTIEPSSSNSSPLENFIFDLIMMDLEEGTLPFYSPAFDTLKFLDKKYWNEFSLMKQTSTGNNNKRAYFKQSLREHKKMFNVLKACLNWDSNERNSAKELLTMKWFDKQDEE